MSHISAEPFAVARYRLARPNPVMYNRSAIDPRPTAKTDGFTSAVANNNDRELFSPPVLSKPEREAIYSQQGHHC